MKVKRIILSSLLTVGIVGMCGYAVASKIEFNKITDSKLVDLIGSKEVLGDTKFTSSITMNRSNVETLVSKDGVIDKKYVDYGSKIDKRLTRGSDDSSFVENEQFSAALIIRENKGILIRYKNKETNKYEEFQIDDKEMAKGRFSNLYIKDNLLYYVHSKNRESIFKINLTEHKLIKEFNFPNKGISNIESSNKAIVKDNKMYIPATGATTGEGIRVFIFDLDKETFEVKEAPANKIGNLYATASSFYYDDKYICNSKFNTDKRELNLLLYNIETGTSQEFIMKEDVFKRFKTIFINQCMVKENKLYVCGRVETSNGGNSFVSIIDLSKNSLDYMGIVKYNLETFWAYTKFE